MTAAPQDVCETGDQVSTRFPSRTACCRTLLVPSLGRLLGIYGRLLLLISGIDPSLGLGRYCNWGWFFFFFHMWAGRTAGKLPAVRRRVPGHLVAKRLCKRNSRCVLVIYCRFLQEYPAVAL